MTTEYTAVLRLNKPDFRDPGWSPLVNDNMDNIDRAITAALAGANFVEWTNDTAFEQGQIAIDTDVTPSAYYICNVSHTSAVAPTTFAQDRAAHPTYWSVFLFNYRARGAWTHNTQYLINDIAYDATLGITGIAKTAHISNMAGTIVDDAANWDFIVYLPSSLPASQITYNPATSGLGVTNVQAAIDAVDAINDTQNTRLTTAEGNITNLQGRMTTAETNITTLQGKQARDGWDVGDVKISYKSTARSGWIVMNDGSIGNAISGATTWASALAIDLFTAMWDSVSNAYAPVSGGRGANAAADFAANKTLTLTRMAGRAIIGAFGGAGLTNRTVGEYGGVEAFSLGVSNLPSHAHGGSTGTESADHTHGYVRSSSLNSSTGGGGFQCNAGEFNTSTGGRSAAHTHAIPAEGSGIAISQMQPYTTVYFHIRALP